MRDLVKKWLNESDIEFINCRARGHSWNWSAEKVFIKNGQYHDTVPCSECETLKTQIITARGEIVSTHYMYPSGYVIIGNYAATKEDRALIRRSRFELMR